ncbi:MAG: PD40 domain-containing protein [Verrucomicrobia bacterium]|nr:PD40 domain-containing protein [Verrucomicrobiota bacterium]
MKTTRTLTVVGCLWLGVAVEAWAQGGLFSEFQAVSVAAPGLASAAGNGLSGASVVSADGRFVAFVSAADNLVANDLSRSALGSYLDVFVRGLATGKTTLVSVTPDGATSGNGHSVAASISADGRYVAFESEASNLVANDTNGAADVFLRDLQTGTTVLVSANPAGAPGNGASTNPTVTPDGHYVVFESAASDLVAGDTNGLGDVFVRDLQTGVTTLVSASAAGEPGLDASRWPVITPDGRYVAFESTATNLVPEVPLSPGQVYLRDLTSQTTKWIGGAAAGAYLSFTNVVLTNLSSGALTYFSFNAAVSDDGRYVAFKAAGFSLPTLVVRHDVQTGTTELTSRAGTAASPNIEDASGPKMSADGRMIAYAEALTQIDQAAVWVWDGQSKSSNLVSVNLAGTGPAKGLADTPAISADGRFVAFLSDATDLVTNATDGSFQVYVRDLVNGTTRLVSAKADGSAGGSCEGAGPTLSADGRVIAFESFDGGLVAHDENSSDDVFARDMSNDSVSLVSQIAPGLGSVTGAGQSSTSPNSISADGRYVVFVSLADNLVPNDTNEQGDVFVRDVVSGTTRLVSATPAGVPGNAPSFEPVLSADGRYAAFVSRASDLAPNDANTREDVFLRDLQTGTTTLVSSRHDGTTSADGASFRPMLSADGRYVAYESYASDLMADVSDAPPTSTFGSNDVFVFDQVTQKNSLISVSVDQPGKAANQSSWPVISSDGRYVAFQSRGFVMVIPNPPLFVGPGLFVRDLAIQTTHLVADLTSRVILEAPTGPLFSTDGRWLAYQTPSTVFVHDLIAKSNETICSSCSSPSLSADGQLLAFESRPPLTVVREVRVRDRRTGATMRISTGPDQASPGNGNSSSSRIAADGRFVVFESRASDLVPNDGNGFTDVFAHDLVSGVTLLLSRSQVGGGTASSLSVDPIIGPDGRTVVFESFASDLSTGDLNAAADVFLLRLNDADSDGDQLMDDWEAFYFGDLTRETHGDADGDGLDNRAEFLAGSNPASAASVFTASLLRAPDGSRLISWRPLGGRRSEVQFKNALNDPQWLPVTGSFGMIGEASGFMDSTAGQAGGRFYRVVILP